MNHIYSTLRDAVCPFPLETRPSRFSFSLSASTPSKTRPSLFEPSPLAATASYPPPDSLSTPFPALSIAKLRGGSCNDTTTTTGDGNNNKKKSWNRKLGNDERVPAALWFVAGGSGKSPTAGQMRACRKVAKAEADAKEKARDAAKKVDAEWAAARKKEGSKGFWGRWKRRKEGGGGSGHSSNADEAEGGGDAAATS